MKKPEKSNESDSQPIPFNEALKRVWSAPPAPKKAAAKKKTKRKPGQLSRRTES